MQKQAAVTETARWGRRLTKPRVDDLQLGAETRSELRTTRSPPGAARHTGSEGKCYAINLNPAPFTARSLPVRNSAQPRSSSHNILRNFGGGKTQTKTCTKTVRQTVSCIMKQAQGYVSKDNWDLQAVQVHRMNLVPKGRFLHWYFRRMRKPLKSTYPPPFLRRDATSTLSPAPHPCAAGQDPATHGF